MLRAPRINALWLALFIAPAALTVAACGKDDKVVNPPNDGYLPATAAANEADDADFFFRQYPKEPIGGQPSWKIVYWRDKPVVRAGLSVESRSWGAIKNLYW